MRRILPIISLCLIFAAITHAQSSVRYAFAIDKGRMLFHDKVDNEQKKLYTKTANGSKEIAVSKDENINLQVENAIIGEVDDLQEKVELDSTLSDNNKKKYLRSLEYLVKGYNSYLGKKDFPASIAPAIVQQFQLAMELDRKNESIEPVIRNSSYPVGKIVTECFSFPENSGVKASRIVVMRKYLALHPNEILPTLKNNINLPFTDSLIMVVAHQNPQQLYDYAAARDALGSRIRSNPDPMAKIVSRMAASKSGQQYFPFIDLLVNDKISFEEIDRVKDDDLNYYRLLVKTRIEFVERTLSPAKDTPMGMQALTSKMERKAKDHFIGEINRLHVVENDNVRFRVLDPLTAQELYYLCVLGEDEIYTSSYVRGVFPRIFQRMKVPRGDSLLISVHADYFRKFIKMAAAYNTLDTLLKSMPADNATTLMRAFMFGLEKKTTVDNAEDAVDVADSYSSIFEKNKSLASFMLNEANWNYERCLRNGDKNGQIVYNLERTLFESADTTLKIDLSQKLGIPPIYSVDYNSLADDSGKVVQQVFFYGDEDKDGQNSYANFMQLFRGKPDWSISENPDWVAIKSTKGKPVWIFANKPLYGPDDPDAKAQDKLNDFLVAKNLKPTVYIHRGHSYHVKYSLQQIKPSARIVVLGSCGGYNNLNDVLNISEDAHIISSKQVGTKTVNEPILLSINNTLRSGRSIDWIGMWRDLSKQFSGESKEKFDDYIPPYKNLGVIFIKSYRQAMVK